MDTNIINQATMQTIMVLNAELSFTVLNIILGYSIRALKKLDSWLKFHNLWD